MPDGGALRQLFEHAPAAVAVVTGEAHTLVYANAAFHDLVGDVAVADVVLGAPVAAAFPATAARALLAVLDRVRVSGRSGRGAIPVAPSGHVGGTDAWPCTAWPYSAAESIIVAVDASSAAALARAQHRDVTEQVLLSAFREEARADVADTARTAAEEANAARGRFLASTSHELRTPLQAIGGYAELLEMGLRGPVTDGQRDALARIQQAMRHVLGLTTALLDYAKLEAGQVEYAFAAVPIPAALHDAAALVAPQAGAKAITLTVASGDAALAVCADAGKLRQVLVNLLANAVKFTAANGAVTMSCVAAAGASTDRAAARGSDRVAIRVTDTGCGIAADQLARVFDPYVQVGQRLTTRDAGVGLGLAVSRELARGMAGELTAESELGVGSTFTLTLPRAATP